MVKGRLIPLIETQSTSQSILDRQLVESQLISTDTPMSVGQLSADYWSSVNRDVIQVSTESSIEC